MARRISTAGSGGFFRRIVQVGTLATILVGATLGYKQCSNVIEYKDENRQAFSDENRIKQALTDNNLDSAHSMIDSCEQTSCVSDLVLSQLKAQYESARLTADDKAKKDSLQSIQDQLVNNLEYALDNWQPISANQFFDQLSDSSTLPSGQIQRWQERLDLISPASLEDTLTSTTPSHELVESVISSAQYSNALKQDLASVRLASLSDQAQTLLSQKAPPQVVLEVAGDMSTELTLYQDLLDGQSSTPFLQRLAQSARTYVNLATKTGESFVARESPWVGAQVKPNMQSSDSWNWFYKKQRRALTTDSSHGTILSVDGTRALVEFDPSQLDLESSDYVGAAFVPSVDPDQRVLLYDLSELEIVKADSSRLFNPLGEDLMPGQQVRYTSSKHDNGFDESYNSWRAQSFAPGMVGTVLEKQSNGYYIEFSSEGHYPYRAPSEATREVQQRVGHAGVAKFTSPELEPGVYLNNKQLLAMQNFIGRLEAYD